jgi:hypothetical protein
MANSLLKVMFASLLFLIVNRTFKQEHNFLDSMLGRTVAAAAGAPYFALYYVYLLNFVFSGR